MKETHKNTLKFFKRYLNGEISESECKIEVDNIISKMGISNPVILERPTIYVKGETFEEMCNKSNETL